MKESITPCIWFNGNGKEAAELYCSVFEKAKITSQSPIVTEIRVGSQNFILLDGGPMYQPNPSISFYYVCEKEDELNKVWNALSTGGNIMMALDKYPWGEKYGWLSDKFGVSWQIALGKISDVGQKITPCLLFTGDQYGRAEEAIDHYSAVFREVKIDGILRYGPTEAPDQEGKIKHAQFSLNDYKMMIMESAHGHKFGFSEGVSLTINCDTQEAIDHYWYKLTEGGAESMCGWLKDRFGVSWQVVPTLLGKIMSDPNKAGKAAKAFMSMRKLDIEQIVQASIT
jgi:predicted 3-demethylubiquinone-9 3-methyltransferase (glyoxalase superfamily)